MGGDRIPHSRPTPAPGEEDAVVAVLRSGQHAGGAVRRTSEGRFARRVSVPNAIAVQSGYAALHLALVGLGVERGDRVLIPSYVCASLLHAVSVIGAEPVIADVDPALFNMTTETAEAALRREGLSERDVRAAIVPHILGYPAPLHRWELEVPVVEDCAMALGARIGDEDVGGFTRVGIFSFYATKMISSGQGGMVVTSDNALADELRDRLQYDNRDEWRLAFNYPLPDLAAALGMAQLDHLDRFLEQRHALATVYRDRARQWGVPTQEIYPETTPNFFRMTLRLPDRATRERVQGDLEGWGIETKPPVFRPLHQYAGLDPALFPGAEAVYDGALSLPIYPSLTDDELTRVLTAVERSLG